MRHKREGAPTVVSRFVQRLAAVAGPEPWADVKNRGTTISRLGACARPPGEVEAAKRPEPRPPVALRPKRLPVTDIEHWLRDPYTIYAKHILKLQALDPVDTPPGARDRGTVIHKAIGDFTEKFAGGLPADPLAELMALGREAFAPLNDFRKPSVLVAALRAHRALVRRLGDRAPAQCRRRFTLRSAANCRSRRIFMLTARADRIEQRSDGSFAVLDYKTGRPPSPKEVRVGFAPQLTLQATILRHGAFENVPTGGVGLRTDVSASQWRRSRRRESAARL